MFKLFTKFLDLLHFLCIGIGGISICVMSIIICWGVFTRYVLEAGSFWPEPVSIFLIIQFTFYGAVACYREDQHIGVAFFVNKLPIKLQIVQQYAIPILMAAISLFMLIYGIELVAITLFQTYPDFEFIKVGVAYSPIPISGGIMFLFSIEKIILLTLKNKEVV